MHCWKLATLTLGSTSTLLKNVKYDIFIFESSHDDDEGSSNEEWAIPPKHCGNKDFQESHTEVDLFHGRLKPDRIVINDAIKMQCFCKA
jgi:hypothetical protein